MTTRLHPPTGLGTAPLHKVEHVSAENLSKGKVVILVADVKMFVKPAGVIPPPLGAELRLVLHSPGPSGLGEPRRRSLYLRLGDVLWMTADLQEAELRVKPTGITEICS